MATLAITNAGTIVSGDLEQPLVPDADTLVCRDGKIAAIGRRETLADQVAEADRLIDAHGSTVAPGLIDSHCHVVLGDYTPRQKTVDFLDSYVHGGITSVISPGEIHAPGRPRDATGLKALAIAARACFLNFRPNGMRVYAGSVVLEPTLQEEDFAQLERAGVWLAKFGFGTYADPADGEPQIRWAQQHGITVMCHSGGASIPGSKPITAEHLVKLRPDVCGNANGGPTALPDAGVGHTNRDRRDAARRDQDGGRDRGVDRPRPGRLLGASDRQQRPRLPTTRRAAAGRRRRRSGHHRRALGLGRRDRARGSGAG